MPKDPQIQAAVTRHAQNDMANIPTASHEPPKQKGRKLGDEHAISMLKLGAHELTAALQALPDSNIRPMEEPGVFGNASMPHINPEPTHDQSIQDYASRGSNNNDRSRSR